MERLENVMQKGLSQIDAPNPSSDWTLQKLAGDASLRKYYRWRNQEQSFVLMKTEPFDPVKNDFLQIRDYLDVRGIPVPKLHCVDGGNGAILLEDLGDSTLLHALSLNSSPEYQKKYLKRSIELLVNFHTKTVKDEGSPNLKGFDLAFDTEKLMWEVDFTLKHLFTSYLRREIQAHDFSEMRNSFQRICEELAAEPRVFTHRDFHSRNLMLTKEDRLVCIDFQDARMGPRAYDLASILRDSYFQMSEECVYEMVDFYLQLLNSSKGIHLSRNQFIRSFDLMSIQRNFKAIGSFTSFLANRNDASYIRFVGNTFENIRRNLEKFPEFEPLRKILVHYYYF